MALGKPLKRSEHEEQKIVVEYLRARGILFCAVPNAARRSPRQAARLKSEGLESGVPDILIFDEPSGVTVTRGFAIEMKVKGNKPTENQLSWMRKLSEHGWKVAVCYSADEAISKLREWGF